MARFTVRTSRGYVRVLLVYARPSLHSGGIHQPFWTAAPAFCTFLPGIFPPPKLVHETTKDTIHKSNQTKR